MSPCPQETARLKDTLKKGAAVKAAEEAGVVVRTAADIRKKASNFFPLLEVGFYEDTLKYKFND